MKPVKSFRIDQELLDDAKKQGIDIAKLIELTLAKMLNKKKCPVCGGPLNRGKK